MAKLSAHGREIGRMYYTTFAKAYMADGVILFTEAGKWKVYGKCKPGVTPEQAFALAKQKQAELYEEKPALREYRKRLLWVAGLGKAWKLHAAIQLLGDDVDGIWSECCDGFGDNIHADVDEIAELVRLYTVAVERAGTEA
ncbi:MAG: hypothetical protein HGB04_06595 [Chlorobiaceae bacterium]|nr:hypothetical protein [Chlorobiaceae bacterium]